MPYGTVSDMNAYLALTGRSIDVAQQAFALEAGSMYIDTVYWDEFCGNPASDESAFPREGQDTVPVRVERAAYEAAYLWSQDPASLSGGGTAGGQVIREKVDVIEVAYASPTGDYLDGVTPRYSIIDGLLRPYICKTPEGGVGGWAFVV